MDLTRIELELETTQLSELMQKLDMDEMEVKEREGRIKDLQDVLMVTESERAGKESDIVKLEQRLQEIMVSLKEKQEDLHAMHTSNKQISKTEEVTAATDMRTTIESLMNGASSSAAAIKKDDYEDDDNLLESVEVRSPGSVQEKMHFRLTQNLDFHGLLLTAVTYFRLGKDITDANVHDHFRLVGPRSTIWPLEERVVDFLKTQANSDWYIEIEESAKEKTEVKDDDEEEEETAAAEVDDTEGVILVYPPKETRAEVIREMLIFISFAILFVIVLYTGRNIMNNQLAYQTHRDEIVGNQYGPDNILTFNLMLTWDEFWGWVDGGDGTGPLASGIFPYELMPVTAQNIIGAPATEMLGVNKLVRGIRFTQQRMPAISFSDCVTSPNQFIRVNNATKQVQSFFQYCYKGYSEGARDTSDFGPGDTVEGFYFRHANHSYHTSGYFANYDNDGYIYNMNDLNPNGVSWLNMYNTLKDNNWIDQQTRAVQIDLMTYNANFDLYTCVHFLIEFTPSGHLNPTFIIDTFSMDVYQGWQRLHPNVTSILIVILAAFMLYFMRGEIEELKMCKKITGGFFKYFQQVWNVVDLGIIALFWVAQGCRIFFYIDPRRYNWNPFQYGYVEMYDLARLYNTAYKLDAGVILLITFKLFRYFQLSKDMALLWNTLTGAGITLLYYVFFFMVIQTGFAFMGMNLFGSSLFAFSTFGRTFETTLLWILGDIDYPDMKRVEPIWAPFYFAFYILIVFYILLNIFLAILNESYGRESARMAEEKLLGGKKNVNKLRHMMKIVKQSMRELRKAKELAKLEEKALKAEWLESKDEKGSTEKKDKKK